MDYNKFAADVGNLWKHGSVHLPHLAATYSDLATTLHGLSQSEANAFNRSYEDMEASRTSWVNMRQLVQRGLADASRTLDTVGKILCQAAEHYAQTDEAAAQALKARQDEIANPRTDPKGKPPTRDVPTAPLPEDPPEDRRRPTNGPV